ncbi:alpha/beta fold hydrolase [Nonomuraea sp. NPDC050783]|uniref:alpha/beta fold hydrolase n=1 Tax=Nonomuraea sp. NPDC050783 TaxID=3154634 RepID=UPI003467A7F6
MDEVTLTAIRAALPAGSEAAFVEGAGHLVPAEKPDRYNELVLRFLARTAPAGRGPPSRAPNGAEP